MDWKLSKRYPTPENKEEATSSGLDVDGIYRVSGNLATIQKLRCIVNQEEKLNLDDSRWEDIHVVTGALKMFFWELPEPSSLTASLSGLWKQSKSKTTIQELKP